MDGVLVDSEDLHWETVGDVLRAHLGDQAPSLTPRIGWGDHALWEELRLQFQLNATATELTAERNFWALKRLANTPPLPMSKALEAIISWRQSAPSLPLVVVSASPKAQIIQSLHHFKDPANQPLFDAYFSGVDDASRNKPAPDPYLTATTHLGLDPQECWIAEDSSTGLTAALASGAQVFAVGAHSASKELTQRCQLSVNTLDQLYDVWKSLI